MAGRPKLSNSSAEKELDKAKEQIDKFEENLKEMTLDSMNKAPQQEQEPQTQISQKQLEKSKDIYLKPIKAIGSREKFNESYREQYNFAKEYVCFIAENKEIIGESIDLWTKPFAGMPAEEWLVPVNTPVWGPRYLAEQIKNCSYHKFTMAEDRKRSFGSDSSGQYYDTMIVDSKVQRLDAVPASTKKSIFMGAFGT